MFYDENESELRRSDECFETAIARAISVGVLERVRISNSFIPTHEKAEGMARENLLDILNAARISINSAGPLTASHQLSYAGAINQTACIDRLGRIDALVTTVMIVALENKAERVHLLMAAPTLGGLGCFL